MIKKLFLLPSSKQNDNQNKWSINLQTIVSLMNVYKGENDENENKKRMAALKDILKPKKPLPFQHIISYSTVDHSFPNQIQISRILHTHIVWHCIRKSYNFELVKTSFFSVRF